MNAKNKKDEESKEWEEREGEACEGKGDEDGKRKKRTKK